MMEELPDHAGELDVESDVEPLEITVLPSASRLLFVRHPRRILSGAAILAAVLVVALFATLFRYHLGSSPNTPGTPNGPTFTQTTLEGISMVSPDEGWIIGNTVTFSVASTPTVTPSQPGSISSYRPLGGLQAVNVSMLFYHYHNGAWNRVTVSLPGGTPHLAAISMDSPTDGWAVGGGAGPVPTSAVGPAHCFLLHFNGQTWQPLSLPIVGMLTGVRMVAPNDGWAVGVSVGVPHSMPIILHYDGSTWTQHALPASLSQGDGMHEALAVRGLAALPTGDAWVMLTRVPFEGAVTVNSPNGGTSISSGATMTGSAPGAQSLPDTVILHSNGNPWTVQATLPGMVLNGFDMATADSGWAVGSGVSVGPPPAHITSPAALNSPLFLRYAGGTWTPVPTKVLSDDSHQLMMSTLAMLSPTDGWSVGMSQATQGGMIAVNGGPQPVSPALTAPNVPRETALLAHFDGTTWVPVKGPPLPSDTLATVSGASFGGSGDGWIVGTLLIPPGHDYTPNAPIVTRTAPLLLHYAHDVWSTVDLQV